MTTNEAFTIMIATKGMARKLGISDSTFGSIKNAFKTGKKTVSLDKKIELLQRAGYSIQQDIIWRKADVTYKCQGCFKEMPIIANGGFVVADGDVKCPDCGCEWFSEIKT